MKKDTIIVTLDPYEEGAVLMALNTMRNTALEQGRPTDIFDCLLLKILHAPRRKGKVRDEVR